MSDDAILHLIAAQEALLAVLDDAGDPERLERANRALAAALAAVDAGDAFDPPVREAVLGALRTADLARARLNALADRNRRSLDRLLALAGAPRAQSYRRTGQLA